MVTLEEAKQIAAEWLSDISDCTEYTTAYVFYNPRSKNSIGGWDASARVSGNAGAAERGCRRRAAKVLRTGQCLGRREIPCGLSRFRRGELS